TVAGVLLSAIPTVGSIASVWFTHQVGAGPFYVALGLVVALATLSGVALRWAIAASLAGVAITGLIAWNVVLLPTPPDQLMFNAVALAALTATIVGVHSRSYNKVLAQVAQQQARAAHVEARYRLITENTVGLVALIDPRNEVSYASPSFERAIGRSPVGEPVTRVLSDEADAPKLEALLANARNGMPGQTDVSRTGEQGVRSYDCHLSQVTDSELLLLTARDVTAERLMATELEQAKKMEALGRFAGSIAHDFNNLLSVMRTCTTLVDQGVPPDSPLRADLNDVQESISRASGLTSQLLAFSRRDVVVPTRVEVGPLLMRVGELSRRLVGQKVTVEVEVEPEVWPLWSGPSQLDQIVMNLASNARDAMPDGGILRISARNAPGSEVGDAVVLTIADSGHGMTAETRAHLFEPFFTTKPPGIGTGLGLATVFGVVKALGGKIEVESQLGKGTWFRIWLPRARDSQVVTAPVLLPETRRPNRPSEATILVVDDDPDVRSLMVRLISQEGFQVVSVGDAEQALTASLTFPELPVLVTDVLLPGRDGLWLAQKLTERYPSMRVVLVSGFAPDPQATARLVAQGARFVQKPFSPGALVQAIRESLGMTPRAQQLPSVRVEA
ncbi:MAG: ATP-binding protein, partial [Archangium sp.]